MYNLIGKRLFDIIISLFSIILFLPLLLMIYVFVYFKLGSPVIFNQERPGKEEKIFKMYKFRTMTDEKNFEGCLLSDAERITKFGEILRATSLDELPELFNVLKGDMSIIGPRPLLIEYLPYYTAKEKLRHNIRPGITGLAQVNGRNFLGWDTRLAYDVEYVENISFILDAKILFKTIYKVIKRSDVSVNTDEVETYMAEERKYRGH